MYGKGLKTRYFKKQATIFEGIESTKMSVKSEHGNISVRIVK